MSILTVTSTNPNLSYILSKNPATITESKKPFVRQVRKGNVYGWFTNPQATEFRLLFIDSPVENSFSESEFEYLDTSRYASPYAPIAMMREALKSALDTPSEYDTDKFQTTVTTNIAIPARVHSRLRISGVTFEPIAAGHEKVSVTSNSVKDALNTLQIICLMASMADEDTYVQLKEQDLVKYIGSLNKFNAPYSLRYMFASRAINNRDMFQKLKPLLETESIKLNFGDTRMQRFDAISKHLTGGDTLIDIGCGEMFQSLRLSKAYETIFAIDADEEIFDKNVRKLKNKQLDDRITAIHSTVDPAWVTENEGIVEGADVLITEVLEHMPKRSSIALMKRLIDSPARKIVVTVPNKDFNVHYGIADDQVRFHDHEWEPTYKEFLEMMMDLTKSPWTLQVGGIGDSIDGCNTSLIAILEKKEEK